MKRKIIQDVIPPKEGKSIRNIPIPNRLSRESVADIKIQEKSKEVQKEKKEDEVVESKSFDVPPIIPSVPSKRMRGVSRFIIFTITFILVSLFIYFIYLFLNIGAIVTVTPKQEEIVVKEAFVAKKNPKEDELGFEVISLVETMNKETPTTGEKKIEKKSRGEIIIYNEYNSQPQRLIKNTRFETPEGLIYRLESSVVVPGQTKNGDKTVPGNISAVVVADEAGEKYNVDLKDFTIPGFKGDPRFDKFYAKSKTQMTGGFNGTIKTASQSDIEIARKELTTTLRDKIEKSISEKVPAGFVIYDEAVFISFETLSNQDDSNVSIKATGNAIIFSKDSMAKILARKYVVGYAGEEVTSTGLNKLQFKPDPKESTPWLTGVFPISIQGTTTLIWVVNTEKLNKDLVGVPKNFVNDIFKNYSGIKKAEVSLTPSWKSVFPEDSKKIEVKINLNN